MNWSCWTDIACVIVALSVWMTPMKGHLSGWLIVFGSQQSLHANAYYRDYDPTIYKEGCGVAAMSPSNLGGTVWLRQQPAEDNPNPAWYGPCGVFDVVSRVDWYHSVYEIPGGDLAEIPRWLAQRWGTEYGLLGEAYYGACPPDEESVPSRYLPPVVVDNRRPIVAYSAWPYPEQKKLLDCSAPPKEYLESE